MDSYHVFMFDMVKGSSVVVFGEVLAGRASGVAIGDEEVSGSVEIVCELGPFFSDAVEFEGSFVSSALGVFDLVLVECELVLVSTSKDLSSLDFVFFDVRRYSNVSEKPLSGSLADDLVLVLLDMSVADAGVIKSVSEDVFETDVRLLDFEVCDPSLVSSVLELFILLVEDGTVGDVEVLESISEAVDLEDVCLNEPVVLPDDSSVLDTFVVFSFADNEIVVAELAAALSVVALPMFSAFLNLRQKLATASPWIGIATVFVASTTVRCSSRAFAKSSDACSVSLSQNVEAVLLGI